MSYSNCCSTQTPTVKPHPTFLDYVAKGFECIFARMTAAEAVNTSQDLKILALEETVQDLEMRIEALENPPEEE